MSRPNALNALGAKELGELSSLRLAARVLAAGMYAGGHRSARRGAGVEFDGHRLYMPGDELRFVDGRASLRSGRLLIRQFSTETERALRLVVDASRSMAFSGRQATALKSDTRSVGRSPHKFAYAALLAAALARVASNAGDPVGLDFLAGEGSTRVAPRAGSEAFDRVTGALATCSPAGNLLNDDKGFEDRLDSALRQARRGSAIIVFSDFLDLPAGALASIAALGTRGRVVVAVEVLDPIEATFPFEGAIVLRAVEGQPFSVQTDGEAVKKAYLQELEARAKGASELLGRHGGTYVRCTTADEPLHILRQILRATLVKT